jgi:hypothetical protein
MPMSNARVAEKMLLWIHKGQVVTSARRCFRLINFICILGRREKWGESRGQRRSMPNETPHPDCRRFIDKPFTLEIGKNTLERDESRFGRIRSWRSDWCIRRVRRCQGSGRPHRRRPQWFAVRPCARSHCLNLAKNCSIGFRSGEYSSGRRAGRLRHG